MKQRSRHPRKEIEAALRYAEAHGWRIEEGGAHAWGRMFCPRNSKDCRCGEFCISSIAGTPRSSGNHAKQLRRVVDNCTQIDDED
jgi:hypothetical protein